MLSKRRNLIETISGGKPDRFVKQFEFMHFITDIPRIKMTKSGDTVTDGWGVTYIYRSDQPGKFPLHDEEHTVLKDIVQWKKYVKAPEIITTEAGWECARNYSSAIDRQEEYATVIAAPGIFEMTHNLMGMEEALISLYTQPDRMRELIAYLEEYEMERAKVLVDKVSPGCLFHHDDWGTQTSTFFSPEMFEEFFMSAYKRIYGFYKRRGIEIIVHHSDSYAATLVPHMIEIGVDIWQGAMSTNNIPDLIRKYGGKISFMGGLDSGVLDGPGWSESQVADYVERVCKECGNLYFIPCLTQGGNRSVFDGVYDAVNSALDRLGGDFNK